MMTNNLKPLVDKEYLLEKYPGKGGWTYAAIPEVLQDKNAPFGWVKVKGSIDGFEIKTYRLMPMGNGKLFLPVKAEIRKEIRKKAGDYVHVILFPDNDPIEVPQEFLSCLKDDPVALSYFYSLNDDEQHRYVKWIYSAKTEHTKVERMVKAIDMFNKKQKKSTLRLG